MSYPLLVMHKRYRSNAMGLAEWVQSQEIARATSYRWFRDKKLPVPAHKIRGLILVDLPDEAPKGQGVV